MEPYLDAVGSTAFPPLGGDVDEIVMVEGVLNLVVHGQPPVRAALCQTRAYG
jgi:hypothetical protein